MSDITLEFAYGVGVLVAVLVAVAAASRLVPSLGRTGRFASLALPRGRIARGVLWLAFAALLTFPLIDLLGFLRSIPEVLTPSAWHSETSAAATAWGTVPWPLYLLLADVLLIAAYVMAFGSLWSPLRRRLDVGGQDGLPRWQAGYTIAVVASLLNSFFQATILRVVWLRVPFELPPSARGILGFSVGWGFGVLFLLVILSLFRNPLSEDDGGTTAA